jgi:hypothetical protein
MVKILKINKVNRTATVEINENELKSIVDSVDYMIDKQKRNLLNLMPEKEDKKKLDNFNALREDLIGVLESLN